MNFGSRLQVSVSVQVLPVGPVTAGAVLWSFILYTEVFGRPYYCYLEYVSVQFDDNNKEKIKKTNKQTDDCNVESCVNRCNLCLCVSQ